MECEIHTLNGSREFRDLGGLETPAGLRVKSGQLFRSNRLCYLSEKDFATLRRARVGLVIDFRGPGERRSHPNLLPTGIATRNLGIYYQQGKEMGLPATMYDGYATDALRRGFKADYFSDLILSCYRNIVHHAKNQFHDFFMELMRVDRSPIIFHCSAGKDRTGIAAMLLLSALGVEKGQIIDDFMKSDRRTQFRVQEFLKYCKKKSMLQVEAADVFPLFCAKEKYINTAMETLEANYGGVLKYIKVELGISNQQLELLRQRYLV